MRASSDSSYHHVHGLSRGLAILRALNAADANGATPSELSEATRLHRTTVKRLLETLVEEGYVRPCDCGGSYGLAPGVLALSNGITKEAQLLLHASPVLKELGESTAWSMRICTPQTDCVIIRDSSHSYSNLSFERSGGLRKALPLLMTAAGRACFAFLSKADRAHTAENLRRNVPSALANSKQLQDELVQRVLDDGYAINDGDWGVRRLGAVGLPIRNRDGDVLASMCMLYTRRAVTQQLIENEFVPTLRSSVDRIETFL